MFNVAKHACDHCTIFSNGGKFRPDYGLLFELHAFTLVARYYALLPSNRSITFPCVILKVVNGLQDEAWEQNCVHGTNPPPLCSHSTLYVHSYRAVQHIQMSPWTASSVQECTCMTGEQTVVRHSQQGFTCVIQQ